jgi:putative sigma-54 modulation protein
MNIKINAVHIDVDDKLKDFVTSKLNKLTVFFDNIMSAEVFIKAEDSQVDGNKIVEIKLEIPGNELFAKKQTESIEKSADGAVEALRKQIIKYKGKLKS